MLAFDCDVLLCPPCGNWAARRVIESKACNWPARGALVVSSENPLKKTSSNLLITVIFRVEL